MTAVTSDAVFDSASLPAALALCSAGRFDDAFALVRPALDARASLDPHTLADAFNVAAVCALGLGDLVNAEACWRRSIALKPDFTDAYRHLGILLKGLNRPHDAATTYRQWIAVDARHAEAHNNLGAVLSGIGEMHDAEAAYRKTLALRPDYAEAHYNLGIVLAETGRLPEAESAYRQSIASRFDCAEAHNNLGNVLRALGRLPEAEQAWRQALTIRPQYAEALNNLGGVLRATRRLREAELACRLATVIRADYAEAHNNLGGVLSDLNRFGEAEAAYRQALALHPDYADAQYNLGVALQALKRLPEAELAYRRALVLCPISVEAYNNLGNVLQLLDRLPEAVAIYREALALRPDLAEAHHNLGTALKALGRFVEAEAAYRQALALRPDYHDAGFSLATLLLAMGRFDEGWRHYEARYSLPRFIHAQTCALLPCPRWQGESLAGKRLLVWQEDGLGDMIQFGRYLSMLKAQGASRIVVVCAKELHRLFVTIDGIDACFDHETGLSQAAQSDCWTSPMSAPLHLRTTLDSIPAAHYLRADASLADTWKARLASLPRGRRVGLVWKGNPKHHNDARRSLPSLATLAPLWSVPDVAFVSLQKGRGEDEALMPPDDQPLLHLGSDVTDFADTAAVVAQLDLLICVDTSTAHLAASLGVPCWVMLPHRDVDWRWMHARDDSPWYPHTVRLFRQTTPGDWSATVARICAALSSTTDRA